MSDPKLGYCPFCGSTDGLEIREYASGRLGGFVECNDCGARGNLVPIPDGLCTIDREAIVAKAWNDAPYLADLESATNRIIVASRNERKAIDIIKQLVWHAEHPAVRHAELRSALADARKFLAEQGDLC